MSEYITMRDCLKLDLKDAITQRDNLQDQRDFAMSEVERLRRERDEAREELQQWRDAAKGAENPHPDEVHCACVPLLLGSLALAQKERDEAREQNEEHARLLAMSADREESCAHSHKTSRSGRSTSSGSKTLTRNC